MDKTLKKIRQRVILAVIWAFIAGVRCAVTTADYRKSPTNFDGGEILICAIALLGPIFLSCVIWSELKELEAPTN